MTCVILCIVYVLFSFSSVFIVIDSVNSLEMHSNEYTGKMDNPLFLLSYDET